MQGTRVLSGRAYVLKLTTILSSSGLYSNSLVWPQMRNLNHVFLTRTACSFLFSFSHLACDEERVEAAKLLVEHGASIYIENKEEKTPLQLAKGGLGNLLRRIVEG